MSIRRAGLFGSAFFVVAALALAPATAIAYNPNNHGHHYGQLKHQQPPPPPNPPPAPSGNPVPASGPTANSHLLTGGSAPSTLPVTTNPPPVTTNPLPVSDPIEAVSAPPAKDAGTSWLLLLILPALLAVWLMVVGRGAVTVARLTRRKPAAA